ncbi:MAG: hypothetical protein ACI8RU_002444 [Zhongshania aliphaticivorans]|jgi:hypothetical protein|uniref:hypothetical protein n=1 Tax=Zhongshania aliphaticivorans TaxID=1470434 RepID=UPI0039E63660
MSKFIGISDQRIYGYLERLLEELDGDYEAMLRKHSADGLLRSGSTIKRAMALVNDGADKLKAFLIEQSSWVIDKSIYVPLSIGEDLIGLNEKYFSFYADQTEEYIRKAATVAGQLQLFDRVYPDVEEFIDRSLREANLETEALVLENRSTGIKGIAKYLFSLVSKLWGG